MAYYGLVVAAMLFVSTQPELQRSLLKTINASFNPMVLAVAAVYEAFEVIYIFPLLV